MKYYILYGGSWSDALQFCQVVDRGSNALDNRNLVLSFRLTKRLKQ